MKMSDKFFTNFERFITSLRSNYFDLHSNRADQFFESLQRTVVYPSGYYDPGSVQGPFTFDAGCGGNWCRITLGKDVSTFDQHHHGVDIPKEIRETFIRKRRRTCKPSHFNKDLSDLPEGFRDVLRKFKMHDIHVANASVKSVGLDSICDFRKVFPALMCALVVQGKLLEIKLNDKEQNALEILLFEHRKYQFVDMVFQSGFRCRPAPNYVNKYPHVLKSLKAFYEKRRESPLSLQRLSANAMVKSMQTDALQGVLTLWHQEQLPPLLAAYSLFDWVTLNDFEALGKRLGTENTEEDEAEDMETKEEEENIRCVDSLVKSENVHEEKAGNASLDEEELDPRRVHILVQSDEEEEDEDEAGSSKQDEEERNRKWIDFLFKKLKQKM